MTAHDDRVARTTAHAAVVPATQPVGADDLRAGERFRVLTPASYVVDLHWFRDGATVGHNGLVNAAKQTEILVAMRAAHLLAWLTDDTIARAATLLRVPNANARALTVRLGADAFGVIGLPPHAGSAMVSRKPDGLIVAIAMTTTGLTAESQVQVAGADAERVYAALAEYTQLTIDPAFAQPHFAMTVGNGAVYRAVSSAALLDLCGPAWTAWQQRHGDGDGAPRVVGAELSPDERAQLERWIAQHLPGKGVALPLSRELLRVVLDFEARTISDDPHEPSRGNIRDQVLARLHDRGAAARVADALTLEAALADAELEVRRQADGGNAWRTSRASAPLIEHGLSALHALFGFDEAASAGDAKPTVAPLLDMDLPGKLAVHNDLICDGDHLAISLHVDWEHLAYDHRLDEQLQARGWAMEIDWHVRCLGGDPEIEQQHVLGSDVTFRRKLTIRPGDTTSIYTITAFVRSSAFNPTRLPSVSVEVKSKQQHLEDLTATALGGKGASALAPTTHMFHEPASVKSLYHPAYDPSFTGVRFDGPLAFEARTAEDRAQVRRDQIAQLESVVVYLSHPAEPRHAEALEAMRDQIARLREEDQQIEAAGAAGWRSFDVRATYLSETDDAASGALDVYGLVRRDGAKVAVELRDQSRRVAAEVLTFTGKATAFEAALEEAFVDLCKAYPKGTMACFAETRDRRGDQATGRTIGFEMLTDSVWRQTKDTAFDPLVQLAGALALAAGMVFAPAFTLPVMVTSVAGAFQSVDDVIERARNGTLTKTRIGVDLATIGLSLLPFAAKAQALAAPFRVLAFGGQVALLVPAFCDTLRELQERDVEAIAELYRQLIELEKTSHPSDPQLAAKRAAIEQRAEQVRHDVYKAFNTVVGQNSLFLASSALGHAGQQAGLAGTEIERRYRSWEDYDNPHPNIGRPVEDTDWHAIHALDREPAPQAPHGIEPVRPGHAAKHESTGAPDEPTTLQPTTAPGGSATSTSDVSPTHEIATGEASPAHEPASAYDAPSAHEPASADGASPAHEHPTARGGAHAPAVAPSEPTAPEPALPREVELAIEASKAPAPDPDRRPGAARDVGALGLQVANTVGGTAYLGEGAFRIELKSGAVDVEIKRTGGNQATLKRAGGRVVVEIPKGLAGVAFERAVVHQLTKVRAQEIRRAAGKKLNAPSDLGPTGRGVALSPADHGKIAELRVLRLHERDALAAGELGRDEAQRMAGQIAELEAELGLAGDAKDAVLRRRAVDVQAEIQDDAARRSAKTRALDGTRGHAGIDLHTHFTGVVGSEVFRKRAAIKRLGQDNGSWLPLLEEIAALEGDNFEHVTEGTEIKRRATAGDATAIAVEELEDIRKLQERRTNRLDGEALAALDYGIEVLARDAIEKALTATPTTDFNSAYEIRDQLIKDTFGARPAAKETGDAHLQGAYDDYIREAVLQLVHDGVSYSEQSAGLKKSGGYLSPEHVQRVIEQMVAEGTLQRGQIDLRVLGMTVTNHFGVRDAHLPPVGEPVKALPGETPEATRARSERERSARIDHDLTRILDQMAAKGVTGFDIGAPELLTFDAIGKQKLKEIYLRLLQWAEQHGTTVVFRPHVGEGSIDTVEGKPFHTDQDRIVEPSGQLSHYERANRNLGAWIEAMEELKAEGKVDVMIDGKLTAIPVQLDSTKVVLRFGHVTHADPYQTARLAALGVTAELNQTSNVATGSISQTRGVHGPRSETPRLDDHSLPTMLFYGAEAVLGTDGGAVMGTTLGQEYAVAHQVIEEVLAGERTVRVRAEDARVGASYRGQLVPGSEPLEYALSIYDMTADERARFTHGYETLYDNAERYYLRRPQPPGAPIGHHPELPFGGAHHLDRAVRAGLIPGTTPGIYEGTRAGVDRAAATYRGAGYTVFEAAKAGGAGVAMVRSPDGHFEVALRAWPDAPDYLPHDDRVDLGQTKSAAEVRDWYHARLAELGALDAGWQAGGVTLAERARRSCEVRRNARLAAREQLRPGEVVPLESRDLDAYGDPDGPTFESLVETLTRNGKTLEQAYEAILESARRSNPGYDARAQARKPRP